MAPISFSPRLEAEYETACYAIKDGGYAIDPEYPKSRIKLIDQNGLAKHDVDKSLEK